MRPVAGPKNLPGAGADQQQRRQRARLALQHALVEQAAEGEPAAPNVIALGRVVITFILGKEYWRWCRRPSL